MARFQSANGRFVESQTPQQFLNKLGNHHVLRQVSHKARELSTALNYGDEVTLTRVDRANNPSGIALWQDWAAGEGGEWPEFVAAVDQVDRGAAEALREYVPPLERVAVERAVQEKRSLVQQQPRIPDRSHVDAQGIERDICKNCADTAEPCPQYTRGTSPRCDQCGCCANVHRRRVQ